MRAKSMTEYVGCMAKDLKTNGHFHSLGHFAASELVAGGVNLGVAARLGHSPRVMATTYLHVDDGRGTAGSRRGRWSVLQWQPFRRVGATR